MRAGLELGVGYERIESTVFNYNNEVTSSAFQTLEGSRESEYRASFFLLLSLLGWLLAAGNVSHMRLQKIFSLS